MVFKDFCVEMLHGAHRPREQNFKIFLNSVLDTNNGGAYMSKEGVSPMNIGRLSVTSCIRENSDECGVEWNRTIEVDSSDVQQGHCTILVGVNIIFNHSSVIGERV